VDWENNRREEPGGEYGPVYQAIERALWALGPALILFMLVGHLSTQTVRQQDDADFAMEIAAENLAFCSNRGDTRGKRRAYELRTRFDRNSGEG
jgi:hypothetical protein